MAKYIGTAEAVNNGEIYATNIKSNAHTYIVDEPTEFGGKYAGAAPGDHLCAALASCKAITLRMYAERKGWKVERIIVKVDLVKDEAAGGNHKFLCGLSVTGELTDEQRKRLLDISKACPVQKLLMKGSEVETVLV